MLEILHFTKLICFAVGLGIAIGQQPGYPAGLQCYSSLTKPNLMLTCPAARYIMPLCIGIINYF